jgi:stearoyl-CoA desaturase (delta-9 desaturase)
MGDAGGGAETPEVTVEARRAELEHPTEATLEAPRLARVETPRISSRELIDSWPFFGVHVVALVGGLLATPTWGDVALCLGLWYARILGISFSYHRYFAHRTFRTSRVFQFLLAVWAMSSAQKGVLWWAGHHRNHHRRSDMPDDLHSPSRSGFLWSHMGWIISHQSERAPVEAIRDMERYPELRWLERWQYLPAILLAVALFALGGTHALIWGFFVSTVILYHTTFAINSLTHQFGKRVYPTTDTSRNSWLLALVTAGEGWHNNHHFFCSSARLGFEWWQYDPTYLLIRICRKLGLVWDVNLPPEHVIRAGRS